LKLKHATAFDGLINMRNLYSAIGLAVSRYKRHQENRVAGNCSSVPLLVGNVVVEYDSDADVFLPHRT
jgi:hypothetical protein